MVVAKERIEKTTTMMMIITTRTVKNIPGSNTHAHTNSFAAVAAAYAAVAAAYAAEAESYKDSYE